MVQSFKTALERGQLQVFLYKAYKNPDRTVCGSVFQRACFFNLFFSHYKLKTFSFLLYVFKLSFCTLPTSLQLLQIIFANSCHPFLFCQCMVSSSFGIIHVTESWNRALIICMRLPFVLFHNNFLIQLIFFIDKGFLVKKHFGNSIEI